MSNLAEDVALETCGAEAAPAPAVEATPGLVVDMAGLTVRRLLPRSRRRLVGPWCFLDAFGPLAFEGRKVLDVPPHPHIGLQTVSWIVEGECVHNDSIGGHGVASPGVVNVMTAGRGIAHSEETPPGAAGRLHGVQLWVALPDASRHAEPGFARHGDLPILSLKGGRAVVFYGALGGAASPAPSFSPAVGAELRLAGGEAVAPLDPEFEHALVVLDGTVALDAVRLGADTLYYLGTGRRDVCLRADGPARALVIGGAPFGETVLMWWNFVARTREEIAAAREDWAAGRRFGEVRAYAGARLEAPPLGARPVVPR